MSIDFYIAKRTGITETLVETDEKSVLREQYQVLVPKDDIRISSDNLLFFARGLPLRGQQRSVGSRILYVSNVKVRRSTTHRQRFFVDLRWEWPYTPPYTDPLEEFLAPSWPRGFKDELVEEDPVTGEQYENTAGDRVAGTNVKRGYPQLVWDNLEEVFDSGLAHEFTDHINSEQVTFFGKTYAKGQVLCESIVGNPEYRKVGTTTDGRSMRQIFYKVTYTFSFSKTGWYYRYANVGYAYKDAETEEKKVILNSDGSAPEVPSKLAMDGSLLPDGEPIIYLQRNKYPEADLRLLNIPQATPAFTLE